MENKNNSLGRRARAAFKDGYTIGVTGENRITKMIEEAVFGEMQRKIEEAEKTIRDSEQIDMQEVNTIYSTIQEIKKNREAFLAGKQAGVFNGNLEEVDMELDNYLGKKVKRNLSERPKILGLRDKKENEPTMDERIYVPPVQKTYTMNNKETSNRARAAITIAALVIAGAIVGYVENAKPETLDNVNAKNMAKPQTQREAFLKELKLDKSQMNMTTDSNGQDVIQIVDNEKEERY